MDLIGHDEKLQYRLLIELIQFQKDVEIANHFLHIFGYEKNLNKLPESLKDFFIQNITIIQTDSNQTARGNQSNVPSDKHYYPDDLLNEINIQFVQTVDEFNTMLDFFEKSKPDAVGLDCEWKVSSNFLKSKLNPSFNLENNKYFLL